MFQRPKTPPAELDALYQERDDLTNQSNAIMLQIFHVNDQLRELEKQSISPSSKAQKIQNYEQQKSVLYQQYSESGLAEKLENNRQRIISLEMETYGRTHLTSPSTKPQPKDQDNGCKL